MTPRRIRRLRGAVGASQHDFGRMLNACFTTVSRWENGHAEPDRWTGIVLRTMENNLQLEPVRAKLADAYLQDDLPIHALAVLLGPLPRGTGG
jgi:transcriptional regulator with XRE-family HTH domain